MFHSTFTTLAAMDRPPCYHRTLLFALSELDPIQWRTLTASTISRETEQSRSSVERALAMLEADGVLLTKGSTVAKRRRINNRLAWASTSDKWHDALPDPHPEDARGR